MNLESIEAGRKHLDVKRKTSGTNIRPVSATSRRSGLAHEISRQDLVAEVMSRGGASRLVADESISSSSEESI